MAVLKCYKFWLNITLCIKNTFLKPTKCKHTFFTTSMPSTTDPKTTCFPSNQEVLAVHKKNCEPLVLGPALAIERIPINKKILNTIWLSPRV